MYEDRPEKDTPPEINDDLREYGGESPEGKPLWRLVLAQNCRFHCFGRKNHVSDGRIQNLEDSPQAMKDFAPDRIEEGEFWLPRFSAKGWILQRWFPPHVWGTQESWESEKAPDGRTRLMAAFPRRGDYMMMCGPWNTIQEAGDLHAAIRTYNRQMQANPVSITNCLQVMAHREEMERQQKSDAYADELEAQYRVGFSGMLRSVSTNAQRVRNAISKHTAGGISLDATLKWGT